MTIVGLLGLTSACLGAVGTICLFHGSFAFEATEGGPFGGPELSAHNRKVTVKNRRRLIWQRSGLLLLLLSFILQGCGALI